MTTYTTMKKNTTAHDVPQMEFIPSTGKFRLDLSHDGSTRTFCESTSCMGIGRVSIAIYIKSPEHAHEIARMAQELSESIGRHYPLRGGKR